MAVLLTGRVIPFGIDAEIDSLLHSLDDDSLVDFIETFKTSISFKDIRLNIYINFLIFRRIGLSRYLEQAV